MNSGKTKKIAVIVSALDEEYQNNIICGINRSAEENQLSVSYFAAFGGLVNSRRFDLGEYSIYDLIDYSKFDGVLLMLNTFGDPEIRKKLLNRINEAKKPTVVFEPTDNPDFYDICIDNFSVMKELVNHIIKRHHARVINCITGPLANPEARSRFDAFREAMAENNIELDEKRIYYGNFRSHDGKEAIDEFMKSGLSLPEAFICANDSMALTVVSSLEKYGYKVPDDVIVTGFDNTFNARNAFPALTTVNRPLLEAGYKACDILVNLLYGNEQPHHTILRSSPVYSESCGCTDETSDDLKTYKKRTYNRMEATNNNIHALNRLAAELAGAETAAATFDVVEKCMNDLNLEKFCLCLNEDWQEVYSTSPDLSDRSLYSQNMTAPLIWDKGERRSLELFPVSDMFPESFGDSFEINYFLPLHFSERCLGYYIIKNSDFPISSLLCHTFSMNLSNSLENIRKLCHLNKAMDELNRLYVIDPLCNIYNRNGFFNIAEDMYKECIAHHKKVMISFIDMDGLKSINDNYGHNEGDFAIQRLAAIIRKCSGTRSICARFGGDEFVIFTANAEESYADDLERRFISALNDINSIVKKPYIISASIGSILTSEENNETIYDIIDKADDKMYAIKKQKKKARTSENS